MQIILFDLMDTFLIDPFYRVLYELKFDETMQKDFTHWRNHSSFEEFERGEIAETEFFQRFYRNGMPEHLVKVLPDPKKLKKRMFRFIKFNTGLLEIVKDLSTNANLQLGIASNYSEWYCEVLRIRKEIELFFDFLFFSSEMGTRKPSAEYFEIINRSLLRSVSGLKSENIMFIDDRKKNVEQARKQGWYVCHFTNAVGLKAELLNFISK